MLEVIRFVNSRFNSNTFIISHPNHEGVWVVDPGDTTAVYEWMKSHQKNSITGVLLTHAHFDHIYGLNEIVSRFPSCIVYIANEYGLDALHNPKVNGSKYTEEGPIVIAEDAKLEFFGDTMLLWDGVVMKTINTPGHSDDSQCLFVENMLFTGDTIIKDVRTVTKLKGGSVEKLEESMKKLEVLKGKHLMVMPGHGEEFELDKYDLSKMNYNPLKKSMAAIMKHDMKEILGEDFFKEEMKCDYLIPAYMKKSWAIQLDIYLTIAEICHKHNLMFFLMFGGLIGAVRHNGFIPWDDDLDVAMPRADYEEFIKLAPRELKYPYFLRTPFTDSTCLYPVIDVCNSETTFIPRIFRRNGFNMGVVVDIFPIDYCNPSDVEKNWPDIITYYLHCTNFMKRDCKGLNERQKNDLIKYFTPDPYASFNKLHTIGATPNNEESDYMFICNALPYDYKRLIWPSRCFEKSIKHKFESMEVEIPVGYDEVLTKTYGDYMSFPPVKERGAKNSQIFFDPDRSYTYYTQMNDEDLEKALGIQY